MTKPTLVRAKELSANAVLEEGEPWYAVATSWWQEFQACSKAHDAPSVRNDVLIDPLISSVDRNVGILKPKLREGVDFVFVPKTSWEVIACDLGVDWEIRREVIYQQSRQQLQLEPYPFAFKASASYSFKRHFLVFIWLFSSLYHTQIMYWTSETTGPQEVLDKAGQVVVVLGSRVHTLGHVLTESWLAASDEFRHYFPQFNPSHATSISSAHTRVCYHTRRSSDKEDVWVPMETMLKRRTSLRRQSRTKEERLDDQASDNDDAASEEAHDEHLPQLDDFRLDNRSEDASGLARLHVLLIEQSVQDRKEMTWPSQGVELQWQLQLAKGDAVDAFDVSHAWFEARLVAAKRKKVCVHYRGWESRWDEWIPRTSSRIAPAYSRVSRWRSVLKPDARVQVGLRLPRRRQIKWRNATVLEVTQSPRAVQGEDEVDGFGLQVHVQVDKEDMWVPGDDDFLCKADTHMESSALTSQERRLVQDDDGPIEPMECKRSRSPSLRPLPSKNALVEPTSGATRANPVRNLSRSFRRVQDRSQSSAGRTPACSRTQDTSDRTSPDSTSCARGDSWKIEEVQTLWTQVGHDLQALQTSWTQLGAKIFAVMEAEGHASRSCGVCRHALDNQPIGRQNATRPWKEKARHARTLATIELVLVVAKGMSYKSDTLARVNPESVQMPPLSLSSMVARLSQSPVDTAIASLLLLGSYITPLDKVSGCSHRKLLIPTSSLCKRSSQEEEESTIGAIAREERAAHVTPTKVNGPRTNRTRVHKSHTRLCQVENCTNLAVSCGCCVRHGGGSRCTVTGCPNRAKLYKKCYHHGGFRPCATQGCTRKAKRYGYCWSHGGGPICEVLGCQKVSTQGGLCWAHGGGNRCKLEGCNRRSYQKCGYYCADHTSLRTSESTHASCNDAGSIDTH